MTGWIWSCPSEIRLRMPYLHPDSQEVRRKAHSHVFRATGAQAALGPGSLGAETANCSRQDHSGRAFLTHLTRALLSQISSWSPQHGIPQTFQLSLLSAFRILQENQGRLLSRERQCQPPRPCLFSLDSSSSSTCSKFCAFYNHCFLAYCCRAEKLFPLMIPCCLRHVYAFEVYKIDT